MEQWVVKIKSEPTPWHHIELVFYLTGLFSISVMLYCQESGGSDVILVFYLVIVFTL